MKLALVLSGGGSKGAFEVGALYHLICKRHIGFDIFSGASVGALNAAYLAQGKDYRNQTEMALSLRKLWLSIKGNRDIYRFDLFKMIHFIFGGSLYHPTGLKKLIESEIHPANLAVGKPLLIPTVALEDGQLYIVDTRNEKDCNEIGSFLLASASIPVYFPIVKMRDMHWVDGGIRDITPLNAVLKERPQVIVVITTYPITRDFEPIFPPFSRTNNTLAIIQRVLNILTAEIGSNDLKVAAKTEPSSRLLMRKRWKMMILISPEMPLTESTLNFSPQLIRKYLALGEEAAQHPRIFII